ncbi:hypothetical protein V5N11_005924 [Cardamine amara subsp. amara]|uniref:Uncharacterized protein n=1 Tax=Cardamine amara subsp. amara TaxID=228776 RepID=A0ABD0Z1A8_CARAN
MINKEVLEGIRQYLLVAKGAERLARADRIKSSLEALKNDLIGQKTMLRLEATPIVSFDLNKGKGLVFDYGDKAARVEPKEKETEIGTGTERLMVNAIKAGRSVAMDTESHQVLLTGVFKRLGGLVHMINVVSSFSAQTSSTVNKTCIFQACSSGTSLFKKFKRKRPHKFQRKKAATTDQSGTILELEKEQEVGKKIRAADEAKATSKVAKCTKKEVVPGEGPSNA